MSKAVLVIEMPDSCEKCKLHSFFGKDCDVICEVQGKTQSYEDAYNSKPEWCPLVPLPEKDEDADFPDDIVAGCANGWNACLDAICGGDK